MVKEGEFVRFPKFRCPKCNLPVPLEKTKRVSKSTREQRDKMTLEQFRESEYLRCPVCDSILEQIMEINE